MTFRPDHREHDFGPSCNDHADNGQVAADAYRAHCEPDDEDLYTVVIDLVADLMHLCDREGFLWDNVVWSATGHWDAERGQPWKED